MLDEVSAAAGGSSHGISEIALSHFADSDLLVPGTVERLEYEINSLLKTMGTMGQSPGCAVAELFSPARFTSECNRFGLEPGVAFDLRTGWDFDIPKHCEAAEKLLERKDPWLLIGSPTCGPFTSLQSLRPDTPESIAEYHRLLAKAYRHLAFCVYLYRKQRARGRRILHEHPEGAWSWKLKMMLDLEAEEGMIKIVGDQCPYGQKSSDELGEGLVRKSTGWLTDDPFIAAAVSRRCLNRSRPRDDPHHRHVHLISGRPRGAERYPRLLVWAILKGLVASMRNAGFLGMLEAGKTCDEMEPVAQFELEQPEDWKQLEQLQAVNIVAHNGNGSDKVYYDEITGLVLKPELVRASRAEELDFADRLGIWERGHTVQECIEATGKPPVPQRFLDINKGDEANPDIRSRLVLMETKRRSTIAADDVASTFSATPPFEGLRILCSWIMSEPVAVKPEEDWVLVIVDISRAHPHVVITRVVYCTLPEELNPGPDEVGLLKKLQYGARDANQGFELKVAEVMDDCNMQRGAFSPCVYKDRDEQRGASSWVHGDDFAIKCRRKDVNSIVSVISKHLITKVKSILGPRSSDDQHARVLNRTITWVRPSFSTTECIEIEADNRHRDLVLRQLGLSKTSKGVKTPGVKIASATKGKDLEQSAVLPYRSTTMRLAFLAQDWWPLKFATKETARFMQVPCEYGDNAVKRIGRFLVDHERIVLTYVRQPKPMELKCFSDSNHADCPFTRKSTSCNAVFAGKHCISFGVTTQIPIALSSAESEWNGLVKAAACLIGSQSLCEDFGWSLPITLLTDASAAVGIGSRRGAGRLKHIDTGLLWLQDLVTRKVVRLLKTPGETNCADLGTKHLTEAKMLQHMKTLGLSFRTGRHTLALDAG